MDNLCTICSDSMKEGYLISCLRLLCSKCLGDIGADEKVFCECGEAIDTTSLVRWTNSLAKTVFDTKDHDQIQTMITTLDAQLQHHEERKDNFYIVWALLERMKAKKMYVDRVYGEYKRDLQESGLSCDNLIMTLDAECKGYELQVEYLSHLLEQVRTMKDHLLLQEKFHNAEVFQVVEKRYGAFLDVVCMNKNTLNHIIELLEKSFYEMNGGVLCRSDIRRLQAVKNQYVLEMRKTGSNWSLTELLEKSFYDMNGGVLCRSDISRLQPVINKYVLEMRKTGGNWSLTGQGEPYPYETLRGNMIFKFTLPTTGSTTQYMTFYLLKDDIMIKSFFPHTVIAHKKSTGLCIGESWFIDERDGVYPEEVLPFLYKGKWRYLQLSHSFTNNHEENCKTKHRGFYWRLICCSLNSDTDIHWVQKSECACTCNSKYPFMSGLTQFNDEQVITYALYEKKLLFLDISSGNVEREVPLHGIKDHDSHSVRLTYLPKKEVIVMLHSSTLHFISLDGYVMHNIVLSEHGWRDSMYMMVVDEKYIVVSYGPDVYSVSLV